MNDNENYKNNIPSFSSTSKCVISACSSCVSIGACSSEYSGLLRSLKKCRLDALDPLNFPCDCVFVNVLRWTGHLSRVYTTRDAWTGSSPSATLQRTSRFGKWMDGLTLKLTWRLSFLFNFA